MVGFDQETDLVGDGGSIKAHHEELAELPEHSIYVREWADSGAMRQWIHT